MNRSLSTHVHACVSDFRQFVKKQISKGAPILHRWTNVDGQLPNVPLVPLPFLSPADAMESKKQHWNTFWGATGSCDVVSNALADLRSNAKIDAANFELPLEQFRTACDNYKKPTRGSDVWLATELASLPEELLLKIVSVLNFSCKTLAWPHQLLLNLNPCLGKKTGGHRTITKTPMLYRTFCLATKGVIKLWENSFTKSFDDSHKGYSALDAAQYRSFRSEVGIALGRCVAGIFFDLHKFFDSISPHLLIKEASLANYPLVHMCMAMQMHLAPRVIQVLTMCARTHCKFTSPYWLAVFILSPSQEHCLAERLKMQTCKCPVNLP